ncbi:MAG: hypothetical protein O3A92_16370, partial [Verrucomicrobia bacterium]|nr:hypothetical protein [Verrucomicrobiota bacterium]
MGLLLGFDHFRDVDLDLGIDAGSEFHLHDHVGVAIGQGRAEAVLEARYLEPLVEVRGDGVHLVQGVGHEAAPEDVLEAGHVASEVHEDLLHAPLPALQGGVNGLRSG